MSVRSQTQPKSVTAQTWRFSGQKISGTPVAEFPSGCLQALLLREHDAYGAEHDKGSRLQERRKGGVMELTVAAAAEVYEHSHPHHAEMTMKTPRAKK